jgi:hypothetical protein
MNYTIREILPGQIRVEFEDESWAMVPIHPQATAEEVDNAVSKYDPNFLPDPETLKNTNVTIGQTRTSAQMTAVNAYEQAKVGIGSTTTLVIDGSSEIRIDTTPQPPTDPAVTQTFTPTIVPNKVEYGLAHAVDVLAAAQYYADNGDTRLKDALYLKVEKFINDPRFSFDELINNLLFDADDIVEQAEAELNG